MSESISRDRMMALDHHPDWDDRREVVPWCQFLGATGLFDTLLAEIAWASDLRGGHCCPQLTITHGGLAIDLIELTQWEAEHLLLCPPCKISCTSAFVYGESPP